MTDNTLETATAELATTASDAIKAVTEAFPEVAGKSLELYAKYVFADGVVSIGIGVCLVVAIISVISLAKKIFLTLEDDGGRFSIVLLGTGLTVLLLLFTLAYLPSGIAQVIAPEGYAIKQIVESVSKSQ